MSKVKVAQSGVFASGDGLFVAEPLESGETFLQDQPLAKLDAEAFVHEDPMLLAAAHTRLEASGGVESVLGTHAGQALWRGPPADSRKAAYISCVDDTWPDGSSEERAKRVEIMMVFSYNAYISEGPGRYQIVYPIISKINHTCKPNARVLAPEDGPGEIVSERALAKDEEVMVSYLSTSDLLRPLPERQSILRKRWSFECVCPRCASPVDDARRFRCQRLGCGGSCMALAGKDTLETACCDQCGCQPSWEEVGAWADQENEIEALMDGLPASLYSAWAKCEDFWKAHPLHGLAGRWKRHLAIRTALDVTDADSDEERTELEAELEQHRAALDECLRAVLAWPDCSGADGAPRMVAT